MQIEHARAASGKRFGWLSRHFHLVSVYNRGPFVAPFVYYFLAMFFVLFCFTVFIFTPHLLKGSVETRMHSGNAMDE
jgi:hypothetical protein